jgi:hypothetical protein
VNYAKAANTREPRQASPRPHSRTIMNAMPLMLFGDTTQQCSFSSPLLAAGQVLLNPPSLKPESMVDGNGFGVKRVGVPRAARQPFSITGAGAKRASYGPGINSRTPLGLGCLPAPREQFQAAENGSGRPNLRTSKNFNRRCPEEAANAQFPRGLKLARA